MTYDILLGLGVECEDPILPRVNSVLKVVDSSEVCASQHELSLTIDFVGEGLVAVIHLIKL